MNCRICGNPPSGRKMEYLSSESGDVVAVECEACEIGARVKEFKESGVIRSRIWLHATLETHYADARGEKPAHLEELREMVRAMEGVKEEAKRFEREVWFKGLQDAVRKAGAGLSWEGASWSVLALATAGRALVTLEGSREESVTLIADEKSRESTMGIQGIHATAAQAKDLITRAVSCWKMGTLKLKEDRQISVM